MDRPRWLRWLHRIGYVTTAIVSAVFVLALSVIGYEAWQANQRYAAYQRETAYVEGPFRHVEYLLPDLARLPPPSSLAPDGLRFIARPELEWRTYAVALRLGPNGSGARGKLLIRDDHPKRPKFSADYPLSVSAADYRWLVRHIDARLDGFPGIRKGGLGTDGTSIVFERVRGRRLTSGGGNFEDPYRALGEDVLRVLHRASSNLPLPPPGNDWYRKETFD